MGALLLPRIRRDGPGSRSSPAELQSAPQPTRGGTAAQILFQAIESLLPQTAIVRHPVGDLLERTRLQPAWPPLRLAAALHPWLTPSPTAWQPKAGETVASWCVDLDGGAPVVHASCARPDA